MKDEYNLETIGASISVMLDFVKIPTLFMRTVLQVHGLYEGMRGFIAKNVLGKLVQKKVWTNQQLWEGFIRCCIVRIHLIISIE